MIKNSSKKRFKKDINILEIQGFIVNTVNNMETQIAETVTYLAQYAQEILQKTYI